MMTVVFILVMAGMAFIFWRVIVGVRQNRAALERSRPSSRTVRAGAANGRPVTPDEFRASGHELIDWIADYIADVDERPVQPSIAPGDVPRRTARAPADGARAVLRGDGRPGSGHRPRPHPVAAPELLRLLPVEQLVPVDPRRAADRRHRRAGHELDHVAGMHRTRNADARLDDRAARPARRPSARRASTVAGSSRARRARRCSSPSSPRAGGPPPARSTPTATRRSSSPTPPRRPTRASRRACASPGSAPTGSVPCRTTTRSPMRPDALDAMIAADRAAGLVPFFVCATRGTTSSLAFDPTPAIGAVLPPRERLAARRRGDVRHRRARTRVPVGQRRPRPRRFVLHQPAQVDGHQLRLQPVLDRPTVTPCSARSASCPSTCGPPQPSRAR